MGYIDYCLIVDSDANRRNELKSAIANAGLTKDIMAALNCGHGLLCLNQSGDKIEGKQGLVILNVKTPIMGGFEFLQELHKEFKHATEKLRIVVISDALTPEEEHHYKSKGILDFLPACCSDETFSTTLKKIFSKPVVRKSKATKEKEEEPTNVSSYSGNQVYFIPAKNSRVG